jgi:hypothetical protein
LASTGQFEGWLLSVELEMRSGELLRPKQLEYNRDSCDFFTDKTISFPANLNISLTSFPYLNSVCCDFQPLQLGQYANTPFRFFNGQGC